MKWLITVKKSADLERLANVIRSCGGKPEQDNAPIPLGDSELVIRTSGPATLPEELKVHSDVVDVYPDSEMDLY